MDPQPFRRPPADGDAAPRKSKKRKLPKIISTNEARALLEAAEREPGVGVRNRLALEIMYRAGLRVSEVVSLRPREIDYTDGIIRLYDAKGGDGTAYFDAHRLLELARAWEAQRVEWLGDSAAVPYFCKPNGDPLTTRYLQRKVKALKAAIGVPEDRILTPHVLRHTFATELIEEGLPLHEVQSAMRHANLQTTAVYLHLRDESLRRKISQRVTPQV